MFCMYYNTISLFNIEYNDMLEVIFVLHAVSSVLLQPYYGRDLNQLLTLAPFKPRIR